MTASDNRETDTTTFKGTKNGNVVTQQSQYQCHDDINNSTTDNNNNNHSYAITTTSKEEARRLWKLWMPMDRDLYTFLQTAQLCMLQKIDEMMNEANIPYWICGGTLIGAIRHGGLIPHDDDIDIECFAEDLEKIAAIPVDEDFFTEFVPHKGNWKGHPVAKLSFFQGMLEVDVFPRPSPLPTGEDYFPAQDEVFPRTQYPFHNITVWGPNRGECGAYLDRCYGNDWQDMVCVYNHDFNWYHNAGFHPRKQVLSIDQYNWIVSQANVDSPRAESSARATYERLMGQSFEDMSLKYQQYRSDRAIRWNRAAAEYREQLREQKEAAEI